MLCTLALVGPLAVTFSPCPTTSLGASLRSAPSPSQGQGAAASPERTGFLKDQATRIASHGYFSSVAFDRFEPSPDFVFLVQKDPAAKEGAARGTVAAYHAWMTAESLRFKSAVATPSQLQRMHGGAPHLVFLLTSSGDYSNYLENTGRVCAAHRGASYDPFLSATITFQRSFGSSPKGEKKRVDQRHAFLHSLEEAYGRSDSTLPGPEWLSEGMAVLASLSAAPSEPAPPPLRGTDLTPKLPKTILKALVESDQKNGHRRGELRSVDALVSVAKRSAFRRAIPAAARRSLRTLTILSYQCAALVKFLQDGAGGQHREALARYTGVVYATPGAGRADAVSALGDLAALDKAFWAYVYASYKEVEPLFVGEPNPRTAAGAALGPKPANAPTFDPGSFQLGPDDTDARFGLALFDAREGRLRSAAKELAKLTEETDNARFEREWRRVKGFLGARDAFLSHLVEKGRKLRIELGGEKLIAAVDSRDGDTLILGSNRLDLEQLSVHEIDIVELADAMADEKGDFGTPLTLPYAYALREDERLKRKLRRLDDDGGLGDDAASLGSHIAVGTLASLIRRLSTLKLDSLDRASGQQALEDLRVVGGYASDVDFLARRTDNLKALASAVCHSQALNAGLDDLLNGKAESLGEDRWRISYDFSDASQLDDFQRDDDYYKTQGRLFTPIGVPADMGICEVKDGALTLYGGVTLRLPLVFQGPQKFSYEFSQHVVEGSKQNPVFSFLFALCDDRKGSNCSNFNFGGLGVVDHEERYSTYTADVVQHLMFPEQSYRVTLELAGQELTWSLDGEQRHAVPTTKRDSGEILLKVHNELEFRLESLSIEGTLSPDSLHRLRADRAAALLADFTFE